MSIERATRPVLLVSGVTAVAFQTYLGARAWAHLLPLNATLFLLAAFLASWKPRVARWVVLGPAYVFPAVVLVFLHGFDDALWSVWTALLVGYFVGRAPFSSWALPPRWRWPLGLWGLSVAVSWPIVVWRELDFTLSQLDRYNTGVTNIGIPPAVEGLWIAHVAATHLIGILWIDSLYRDDAAGRGEAMAPSAIGPLLLSVLASAALGLYQAFGHMDTLNAGVFEVAHRASGAMLDGNAFGMAAALWLAGAAALAAIATSARRRLAAAAAVVALAVAVWSSGSQSALFAAGIGAAGVLFGLWRARAVWSRRRIAWVAVGAALVGLVAVSLVSRRGAEVVGPIARFRLVAQAARDEGRFGWVAILWNRNRYGAVATAMVRQFPVTGIGIGTFNTLVLDESLHLGLGATTPDNAQNWFRHQLAEMGLLGCVGWLAWLAVFLPTLWARPASRSSPVASYAVRGALIGLGLASQIAMPTQNTAVLLTFWTFVFWHGQLVDRPVDRPSAAAVPRWLWPAALVGVVVFAGATWWVGQTTLRVPERAALVGWPYEHGLYDLEKPPGRQPYRWTGARAVFTIVVPPAETPTVRYVPVTFWASHPDIRDRPVHVKIWIRGRLAVDLSLSDAQPVTRFLPLRPDEHGVMVETWVDRTWRPSDGGQADARALGIALADWTFVCCPPEGAVVLR